MRSPNHRTKVNRAMSKEKLTAEELQEQYDRGVRIFDSKDLSGENCQDFHIPGIRFDRVNLEDANFRGANLEKCEFYSCELNGTIFDGANLKHSDFYRKKIEYTDFSNADLRYSAFGKTTFSHANFFRANLSYCKTSETWFDNCYFSRSELKYANFLDVYFLGNCIFLNVDFEGCLFRYAANGSNYCTPFKDEVYYFVPNIPEEHLEKAYILKPHSNLSCANFSQIPNLDSLIASGLNDLDLNHADLSHANLSRVNLSHVDLDKFNLAKALPMYFPNLNLSYANLKHSILIKLRIHRGNLQQAQLDFCQIIATSIKDTDFSGSSLRYASFKNSHLRNVSFQDCQFENTDFTNTYIYGDVQIPPEVDLSQAHLLPADAPYPDPLFG
ncbi:Pentapeptide repeat family protein [Geitlerinema sp. FC II]|nr:Pentapeptide repeat family protein [Geitlerinema sp. FC II]